jgi:hypothetical protein
MRVWKKIKTIDECIFLWATFEEIGPSRVCGNEHKTGRILPKLVTGLSESGFRADATKNEENHYLVL